jgi:[ribosomal protein S18]-alanine N-acetyltransferase
VKSSPDPGSNSGSRPDPGSGSRPDADSGAGPDANSGAGPDADRIRPASDRSALRAMTAVDLPAVLALERALFPDDAWSDAMFRAELAAPPGSRYFVVAEEAGEVVGYAGLGLAGPESDVQTIAVARAYWSKGIGSALLAALLAEARRRRCVAVFLEVRADNPRAQKLYQRFGFEEVGVRRGYYQPIGVDAIVMRLLLEDTDG